MSSVQDKSSKLQDKRSFFMRSGSLEKLKCSAKYPFRLVGVKLSKTAFIELVDTIIVKARIFSQKVLLVLFIAIFKIVGVIFSLLVGTSANPLSVVRVCDKSNVNKSLGFYERVQEKLEKLQKHKKRLESLKKFDGQTLPNENNNVIPVAKSNKVEETTGNVIKKDNEFHAEIQRLRAFTEEPKKLSSRSGSILEQRTITRRLLEKIFLFPLVYGSIGFMIIQLYFLGIILNRSTITLGFLFLIGSLAAIGVLTFKVFLVQKFQKTKGNHPSQKRKPDNYHHSTTATNTTSSNSKFSEETSKRQSRSRLKKSLDLSSKTLSKIKLL